MGNQLLNRRLLILPLLLLLVAAPTVSAEQEADRSEIESAFLFHFASLVRWPAAAFSSPAAPLVIGLLGKVDHEVFDTTLSSKTAKSRPILVRRLKSPSDATGCHIVYAAASSDSLPRLQQLAIQEHFLLVADESAPTDSGAAIRFFPNQGRLAFEIDQKQAAQAGLEIDSFLLAYARRLGRS